MLKFMLLIGTLTLFLLAACTGTTPTATPASTAALQQRVEETVIPVNAPTSASSGVQGPTISELSVTDEQISWRTNDGEDRSLELAKVERAYPDIFDPGLSKFSMRRGPVSPSGQFANPAPGVGPGAVKTDYRALGVGQSEVPAVEN